LFVLEADSLPVGQIRFDRAGDETCIDYSLDSIVRGRDWGLRLVTLGANLMQQIEPARLRAEVKAGNEVSSAVFLRAGFTEITNISGGGYRSFYLDSVGSSELDE
jgi:RimJ/RimL family protein N-acetyltransferase